MFNQLVRWSGLIASVLFVVMIVTVGMITPGYDMRSQFISELAAVDAPYAVYMNLIGIIPFGLGIVLFGFGFLKRVHFNHFTIIGALLLILSGAGFVAAGLFQCDAGCPFEGSQSQVIHNWTAFGAFILAFLAALWIGISALWSAKRAAPLIFGILACAGMAWSFYMMGAGALEHPMIGLFQRGFILSLCLWLFTTSLYSISSRPRV
ncbi:DUF998 domain-containing protein [Hyphococcus flavus]|uniref:DUF998 domain-containing protein n=1 Tax=Hyphococcus flavus TaxID=1866326 RepID=A0AAE9ZEH3_9PROT|nr:DUF998 domain-containing protein [Hyphococcus flavus]WDI31293.1 DUF998 domain-containing protein [Hyphococcus flavus]